MKAKRETIRAALAAEREAKCPYSSASSVKFREQWEKHHREVMERLIKMLQEL